MRSLAFTTMAIFIVGFGCSRKTDHLSKDAHPSNSIFGKWVVTSAEVFGKEIEGNETWGMWITFAPDKAIWHFNTPEGQKSFDGYLRIDASKQPGEIDLRQPKSDDPNRTAYGIYKIEGDTLRISMGPERPKDFTEPSMTKLVFKRVREKNGERDLSQNERGQ